jgi:hypothetical protein
MTVNELLNDYVLCSGLDGTSANRAIIVPLFPTDNTIETEGVHARDDGSGDSHYLCAYGAEELLLDLGFGFSSSLHRRLFILWVLGLGIFFFLFLARGI